LNKCEGCPKDIKGLCCYHSAVFGNNKVRTYPCPYLDLESCLCSIYEQRYELNPLCLTIQQAKVLGNLPEGCLYL
jgi:uncharacterized cysteine cluster protein YcgN (CxxCxxCC family)